MAIGTTVREAREREGISQETLAREVGLTKGAIQHIESGRREPSHRVLEALADRFGWQLRWGNDSAESSKARERTYAILGTLSEPSELVSVA